MVRAINAKEAEKLTIEGGWCWSTDGIKTFYAANENGEVFEFDTKAERDKFVELNK